MSRIEIVNKEKKSTEPPVPPTLSMLVGIVLVSTIVYFFVRRVFLQNIPESDLFVFDIVASVLLVAVCTKALLSKRMVSVKRDLVLEGSIVESITYNEGSANITLNPSVVLEKRDEAEESMGHEVQLVVSNITNAKFLPRSPYGAIKEATLITNTNSLARVPVPFIEKGPVTLRLAFTFGDPIEFMGRGVYVRIVAFDRKNDPDAED